MNKIAIEYTSIKYTIKEKLNEIIKTLEESDKIYEINVIEDINNDCYNGILIKIEKIESRW